MPTRPERITRVRDHFSARVYGLPPAGATVQTTWTVLEEGGSPDGALRRQLRLDLTSATGEQLRLVLLVFLPYGAHADASVPAFCGMNFRGNHACTTDPEVLDLVADPSVGEPLHLDADATVPIRGEQARRWPVAPVVERGWASVTWCYLQLGPDSPDIFGARPHRMFSAHAMTDRDGSEWGAIGIWAWTLSRVFDALAAGMVPEIDPDRIVVHGHSRLGKTAIWAGVSDPRFAAVISNESGTLGAAASRPVGETPAALQAQFPHWVAEEFTSLLPRWAQVFDGRPDADLPDQAELLALVAPRPLYVSSAAGDIYADSAAEFHAWQRAAAAWPGGAEAAAGLFPEIGENRAPAEVPIGYHLRPGPHDVLPVDWAAWLDFVERWVRP